MSSTSKPKASVLSTIGYVVWFAVLVRLLYMATNDRASGFAEPLGVHIGLGLALLILLGIPYLVVRLRAKQRGESTSWFLVMMWTSIIALLLTVGGFYGRLHSPVIALQPSTSIQGAWQCTDVLSKESSRYVLNPDGSVSGAVGAGPLMHDSWMHWHLPIQEAGNETTSILRLRIQGPGNIVVQNPKGNVKNCVR